MKRTFFFSILCVILLYSCAGVKLYKNENFTNKTGLKFYYPKPFLLVERNSAKDVAMKTSIIYLPDLSNPVFARVIRGMGSNDLKIALENGSLSSYGVTTDSKIPETIASAGGLLTGAGDLLTGIAAKKTSGSDVQQAASVKDLQEIKTLVDNAKTDIVDTPTAFADFITSNQKNSLGFARNEIINTKKLVDALNPLAVQDIIKSLDKVIANLKDVLCKQETTACKNFNGKFLNLIEQLTKAKEKLQPKDESTLPTFELYEIIMDANGITYKLVKPFINK